MTKSGKNKHHSDLSHRKLLTIQDKCVILQENYRQIRNIREDGNKNTENNGVKSPCRLYVWRLAHTAGAGCKRAICLHEEWVAEQNIKGVYVLSGTTPKLLHAISAYNNQLSKQCIVGAYTALELRGYSHYLSLGKPQAYLFTGRTNKLPSWMLSRVWDMTVKYMTTSFSGG